MNSLVGLIGLRSSCITGLDSVSVFGVAVAIKAVNSRIGTVPLQSPRRWLLLLRIVREPVAQSARLQNFLTVIVVWTAIWSNQFDFCPR